MRHGKYPFIIGFLVLPVVLYAVYVIGPFAQAFQLSLTRWSGFGTPVNVGFDNFKTLLTVDTNFWPAVEHNLWALLVMPVVTIAIALFLAFMLNVGGKTRGGIASGVWGSKFYRVVFFLPQVLAVPIIGVLFQAVYRPDKSGLVGGTLSLIGVEPVGFLTDKHLALWSILAVGVWQAVGFYVVLFSAAMSSLPGELFEAAALDGATRATMFFRITIPLLRETVQVAWVYLGVAAFDLFALVNVLSIDQGGPDGATTVLSEQIYLNAFKYSKAGYASAMGVALFIMTLTFAALIMRTTRREQIEY
ncbi:MAG TPA: sugar ABC transporter permease [Rugosimonospora sp.]|nr:sugar ABC transporter permease [Rugosimonospora sp.]